MVIRDSYHYWQSAQGSDVVHGVVPEAGDLDLPLPVHDSTVYDALYTVYTEL